MTDAIDIKIDDFSGDFREVANIIGIDACKLLINSFSGCQLYIPKLETVTKAKKYRQMYDDFDQFGDYKRVAVKHGLSESRTRQIIIEERRKMRTFQRH